MVMKGRQFSGPVRSLVGYVDGERDYEFSCRKREPNQYSKLAIDVVYAVLDPMTSGLSKSEEVEAVQCVGETLLAWGSDCTLEEYRQYQDALVEENRQLAVQNAELRRALERTKGAA